MPTPASYLRRPGDSEFRAFKFDVLRMEQGVLAEIRTFGAELFPVRPTADTLTTVQKDLTVGQNRIPSGGAGTRVAQNGRPRPPTGSGTIS